MHKRTVMKVISVLVAAFTFWVLISGWTTAQNMKLVPVFCISGEDMEKKLNQPNDVFVDEKYDEIYVLDAGNKRVVVFEMDGFYKHQFAIPSDSGALYGMLVNNVGEILLAIDGKIAVFDFRGNLLEYVDLEGFPYAQKVNVTRIKTDKDNNYYVLDSARQRVLVFDYNWNFGFSIDRENLEIVKGLIYGETQDESEFQPLNISDICVDDESTIYLVDSMASYVFAFDRNGKYKRSIGEPGASFDMLSFPSGVAVDSQGRILVVDTTGHGLLGYNKEGRLLFALGGMGKSQGRFYFPKYISTGKNGRIYIVEPFLSRVQVLTIGGSSESAKNSSPLIGSGTGR